MDFGKLSNYFLEYLPYKDQFILAELVSSFIPIFYCLKYFNFCKNQYLPILIYSFILPIFEIVCNLFSAFSKNNHDIYLIFYIIETALLFWFFSKEIDNSKFTKLLFGLFILIACFFINNIFAESNLMDDIASSFQAIVIIIITLYNFYFILSNPNSLWLSKSILFWFNTGAFIYFSGKFFVALYINEIATLSLELGNYWNIVSISLVVFRVFIAIGIYKSHIKT